MTSFATQAMLYRRMTGDNRFREYDQAAIDWLFGANPWGVSMVIVYHDDMGDYSTNEPIMDGTASLTYLLAALASGKR